MAAAAHPSPAQGSSAGGTSRLRQTQSWGKRKPVLLFFFVFVEKKNSTSEGGRGQGGFQLLRVWRRGEEEGGKSPPRL